jgi:hypothetical protein
MENVKLPLWDTLQPTEKELQWVEKVENSSNPADRLKVLVNGKSYYQIKKQELFCNWGYWFAMPDKSMVALTVDFNMELTELQASYNRDIQMWLELKKQSDKILLLTDLW